jgi:hypothetical protein
MWCLLIWITVSMTFLWIPITRQCPIFTIIPILLLILLNTANSWVILRRKLIIGSQFSIVSVDIYLYWINVAVKLVVNTIFDSVKIISVEISSQLAHLITNFTWILYINIRRVKNVNFDCWILKLFIWL